MQTSIFFLKKYTKRHHCSKCNHNQTNILYGAWEVTWICLFFFIRTCVFFLHAHFTSISRTHFIKMCMRFIKGALHFTADKHIHVTSQAPLFQPFQYFDVAEKVLNVMQFVSFCDYVSHVQVYVFCELCQKFSLRINNVKRI